MATAARIATTGGGVVDVSTRHRLPGVRGKDPLPSDVTD